MPDCTPCRNGNHEFCDTTVSVLDGHRYCMCWADGHDEFVPPDDQVDDLDWHQDKAEDRQIRHMTGEN